MFGVLVEKWNKQETFENIVELFSIDRNSQKRHEAIWVEQFHDSVVESLEMGVFLDILSVEVFHNYKATLIVIQLTSQELNDNNNLLVGYFSIKGTSCDLNW